MASPFSIFRKNQKVLLAVLTLLAMFGFVFLPILGQSLGLKGGGPQDKVVVKTSKFGDLKESNVEDLRHQRQRVLMVLSNLMQAAGASPAWVQQVLDTTFGGATEESVVNYWLLAQHARELGIVISDDTVIRFLKGITDNKINRQGYQAIFKQAGVSELQFLSAMRDELAALELKRMFGFSLGGITPAQRWDYFKRVKQMAKIEAAAVPVASYVDRVPDPGDTELETFFDEYKDKYPLPDSPEPGFRVPQRVALQYFKASLDDFVKKVTDEEIKQQYEKNKGLYEESEKKADLGKATEQSADGANATKSEQTNKLDAGKSIEQPKESAKPQEPAKDKKANGTSSVARPSPFRLTALQQEDKAADKTPAKDEKPDEKSEAPKKEPETAVKLPAPATEQSTTTEKAPAAKSGMSDALKDRVRRDVAYDNIQKVFDKLRTQMDAYEREWRIYDVKRIEAEARKEGDTKVAPPTPPAALDFDKLAKEYGISAGRTELMSQWDARGSEIGMSWVQMREPVYQFAFTSFSKFRPADSIGLKGDLYLFWKTAEAKEKIPKFADEGVRDRVLAEWKLVHARPLAMKEAETLAADADKSGKPLKQAFAEQTDLHVVTPPPFSWITFGSVPLGSAPGAARISQVEDVDAPGNDFMRAVFRLDPGSSAAAFNAPKNIVYVIRLVEFTPSEDVLWKQFEVDDFSKYAPAGARISEMRSKLGWTRSRNRPASSGSASPIKWARQVRVEGNSRIRLG